VAARDEVHRHAWPWLRGLLVAAGWLCVALGVSGIFAPLLRRTPFHAAGRRMSCAQFAPFSATGGWRIEPPAR